MTYFSDVLLPLPLQPADVQRRILLRRAARKVSLENKQHRRQMIHVAGFLNWPQTAQVQWLATAITHFLKQVGRWRY